MGEVRAASTASGGTALTTTATKIVLPQGSKWISLTPRNYVTAVVTKFNFNPWLTIFKTTDALASEANITVYSDAAQDGSTATDVVLSSLDTAANNDYLYVGSHIPFSGVTIDVDLTNGTANTLTVNYRKSDNTWATTGATDGTDSGPSLGQDGDVTWTMPTDWITCSLQDCVTGAAKGLGLLTQPLYWTQWSWSAALDSSTTLNSMLAINLDTTYAELVEGQVFEESITVGPGGMSSVTALTDAGTANLIVNVATRQSGRF